ncbi:MAG: DUF4363 family protein [Ruminococcaceae bacterium]|nr:DUF4363 family protein [Oscillospiraceae bacterium]
MKAAAISLAVLITVLVTVILNSILVSNSIQKITERLENAPSNLESYEIYSEIFEDYMKKQRYIGLTVSHEDLTNIEREFNEIIGSIEAEDEESLIIAKSRLIGALSHLKRLSGINADSIF